MRPSTDRFFLLAPARSGSTWLQQTLDAHPEVTCLPEPSNLHGSPTFRWVTSPLEAVGRVLGQPDFRDRVLARVPLRYEYHLNWLDSQLTRTTKRLAGAKLVLPNLFRNIDFTRFFIRYRDARFILLDRLSAVDGICSWTIARRTRLWNSERIRHEVLTPFAITPERAEQHILSRLLQQRLASTLLHALDMEFVEITYEQLMGDTKATLALLAAFLGVGEFHDYSRLQKLMVRPYKEVVTNYDELVAIETIVRRRLQE